MQPWVLWNAFRKTTSTLNEKITLLFAFRKLMFNLIHLIYVCRRKSRDFRLWSSYNHRCRCTTPYFSQNLSAHYLWMPCNHRCTTPNVLIFYILFSLWMPCNHRCTTPHVANKEDGRPLWMPCNHRCTTPVKYLLFIKQHLWMPCN